ncbi:cellulase family glycosylhydrolase [Chitinophaga nivalis]|uniref:Cellulase family glycosylhydrolase n=1 Tax=Chitinophaga nivalis TaxID=2991709 RepID=A0ABT3IKS1_9BACT|nr:cellulase family glycosylhydrolase [Chitinophaga nivalis]MCW3465762.1 cellulase family glycosylhydrolase [Chitinophaga nivalis]MCW3484547.1 cellulase family glycosylhydrolase [Chitinophaga nivalis]
MQIHVFRHVLWLFVVMTLFTTPAYSQLSRLQANGTRMVNEAGQEVILKGVGLGGWLLQEGYMIKPSFTGGGTQWSIKKRLYDQGQSDAAVENFYQQWRNNFITRADIDYMASLGFNCVRIPLHYELFLTNAQRAVRNGVARNSNTYSSYVSSLGTWYNNNQLFNDASLEGFRLIDSLLAWSTARNIYVVLDLHAAPGAQGTDANIADALKGNDLWNTPIYQDITVRLWQRLSARYHQQNAIAFYDLINEPNNVPDNRWIHALYERLINAIRAQGDNHLLMIEGNGWGNQYDYMEPFTFSNRSNLVYNAHRYWITNSPTTTDPNPNQINLIANLVNFRQTHNVPVWVGETGENNNTWLSENISALNAKGIGWCHWTYKRFDAGENAALRRIPPPYLMDGAGNMNAVLQNIRFENTVANDGTVAAVAPGPPASPAPIGATITLRGFNQAYVSSENGTTPMNCNRTTAGGWEQFVVTAAGNGKIALRSQGKYVSSENGTQAITCNRTSIQDWEKFDWIVNADGKISLRGNNGRYISSENGTQPMTCNRTAISGWEAFTVTILAAATQAEIPISDAVLFPNPAVPGSIVQVQLSTFDAHFPVRVTVTDIRKNVRIDRQYNSSRITFSTDNLSAGYYMVLITNGTTRLVKKLLIP